MHVLVVLFEFKFFTCLALRLLGLGFVLDWQQLSILASSLLCFSCSRLLDKSFSDFGRCRHLVGALFCVLWLHYSVTFSALLAVCLVDCWLLVIVFAGNSYWFLFGNGLSLSLV